MLTAAENEILCRVENDAPMGRLMRRHWVPALLSEQVATPDGTPIRVQLFGERLVAFRDSNGKVGILGENCPHRKASLAFGRNEERRTNFAREMTERLKIPVEAVDSAEAAVRDADIVVMNPGPFSCPRSLGSAYRGLCR